LLRGRSLEKILKGLTEKENVGILLAKNVFGLTFANDFICETFGYTKDELLQLDVTYLMDWQDQEEVIDKYFAVLNGDMKDTKFVSRFVRKDKTIFQSDVNITNHKDTTAVVFENITNTDEIFNDNHKNTLMKAAANYKNNNMGLLIVSNKDGISYVNKMAYEAFGYGKDEMNGISNPKDFTHTSNVAELARKAITVYTGIKSKAEFPIRFIKKDGSVFKADLTLQKHKEDKVKYLILQFNNIDQEETVEAGN